MNVKFPRGLVIDLNDIPNDFEQQIERAFKEYTSGTNPEYMYQDKLCFIDRMSELLHGDYSDEVIVDDWIDKYCEYERHENSKFVTEDDVYCYESMCSMVRVGRESHELYGTYKEKGSREDSKIMKLLCRAIKVVMNYGEPKAPATVVNCKQYGNNCTNIASVKELTIK